MDKYAIGLILSHFQFKQDQVHVTWISLGTFSTLLLSPFIVWILYSLVIKDAMDKDYKKVLKKFYCFKSLHILYSFGTRKQICEIRAPFPVNSMCK